MKITKFVHSCILVETDDYTVLFDPGQFSYESKLFSLDKVNRLDAIVITHEHFDHFSLPFVQSVVQKFPDACVISTEKVVADLQAAGIKNAVCESNKRLHVFSTEKHASLAPIGQAPDNIAVHFDDKLTVGGDRHDLEESKDVLALTVTAPWGSMMDAASMALELKPKVVFPVHDWHWNEQARSGAYDTLESFFKQHGIKFIKPIDGQSFEV